MGGGASSRPLFRPFSARAFNQRFANGRNRAGQNRFYSDAHTAQKVSWFQRMWDSPIGIKTVHFW